MTKNFETADSGRRQSFASSQADTAVELIQTLTNARSSFEHFLERIEDGNFHQGKWIGDDDVASHLAVIRAALKGFEEVEEGLLEIAGGDADGAKEVDDEDHGSPRAARDKLNPEGLGWRRTPVKDGASLQLVRHFYGTNAAFRYALTLAGLQTEDVDNNFDKLARDLGLQVVTHPEKAYARIFDHNGRIARISGETALVDEIADDHVRASVKRHRGAYQEELDQWQTGYDHGFAALIAEATELTGLQGLSFKRWRMEVLSHTGKSLLLSKTWRFSSEADEYLKGVDAGVESAKRFGLNPEGLKLFGRRAESV